MNNNQFTVEDNKKYIDKIVDILLKSKDVSFLTLKLLLMYNNICTVPYENINAYMSMFFNKIKYQVNENIGYLMYCNPIHVCMLLAHAPINECKNVLSILLSELNIIPCGYPVYLRTKNDLLFYTSLFGGDIYDLAILRNLLETKVDSLNLDQLMEIKQNRTSRYSNILTDFISLKYDTDDKETNSDIFKNYNIEPFPIIDNINSESIINEALRAKPMNEIYLKESLKITLKILSGNKSYKDIEKCIPIFDCTNEPDINIKRICKNIFISQLNIFLPSYRHVNVDEDNFLTLISQPELYFDLLCKSIYYSKNIMDTNNKNTDVYKDMIIKNSSKFYSLLNSLMLSNHPIRLAHNYLNVRNELLYHLKK